MSPNYPGHEVAEQALDVMVRRGWFPAIAPESGKWDVMAYIDTGEVDWGGQCMSVMTWFGFKVLKTPTVCRLHDDPFTALVEADRWYKDNVEKGS